MPSILGWWEEGYFQTVFIIISATSLFLFFSSVWILINILKFCPLMALLMIFFYDLESIQNPTNMWKEMLLVLQSLGKGECFRYVQIRGNFI